MRTRSTPPRTPAPLKPIVFHVLLVLLDEERHGWGIVREVERRVGGTLRVLPGNLYRTLREMTAAGLIEESSQHRNRRHDDERRRYFRATPAGRDAARSEVARLDALLEQARALNLVPAGRP